MRSILTVAWLLLLTGFSSCNRQPAHPQNPVLGRYELTAHDNSGRLAFTGTILIVSLEQNHLKGQCTIARERHAPEGIFSRQEGNCEALLDGKKVSFDLAPYMDDAGLLLEGQLGDDRMTGVWMLDGFVTSPPLGRFEAVKKQ